MAIRKRQDRRLATVELISQFDEAVDEEKSDIKSYINDPIKNRDKLVLKEGIEPTIFLCNFQLNGKERSMIDNTMVTGVDEDNSAKMSWGKWKYTVARIVLKAIHNPVGAKDGIEFKKDGTGYASEATMDELYDLGIVDELWSAYVALTSDDKKKQEVKKHAKNS